MLPSATVIALAAPQQVVPICCRAHGTHACMMGSEAGASSDAAPAFRQPGCPFGQNLHALTTVTISADVRSHTGFRLVAIDTDRQAIADAVATSVLRRSAPRGPPSSFLL
jgi:hypothetical protein